MASVERSNQMRGIGALTLNLIIRGKGTYQASQLQSLQGIDQHPPARIHIHSRGKASGRGDPEEPGRLGDPIRYHILYR